MQIHYLEIVTPDVDAQCQIYERIYGMPFSAPQDNLGNARLAEFANGGRIGIRAPMHAGEMPVTRPYFLVDDIDKAVAASEAKGAQIIHPPLEIPGLGIFAICLTGGIEHGFWQL